MRRPDLFPSTEASQAFADAVHREEPGSGVALWSLGGSGILVKSASALLVIDPYLSNRLGDLAPDAPKGWRDRNAPAPVLAQDLTGLDAIFITHSHGDHFDPDTLGALIAANSTAHIVAPRALSEELTRLGADARRVVHPQSDDEAHLGDVSYTAIPSAHVPPEAPALQPDEHGGHDQVGYLVELGGICLYHAGDTIVYEGLIERLPDTVDVAVLPINGRRWSPRQPARRANLDYEEAADLAALLEVRFLVPVHHELLGSSARPIEPFLAYTDELYPSLGVLALRPGERAYVERSLASTRARDRDERGGPM